MFLLALPAQAARLTFWRFDPGQNRLDFRTQGGVQPTAKLLSNPTRLVIDLPGTRHDGGIRNQNLSGLIRSVRVAQFDPQTTRIVLEIQQGYTIDPQQVRFQGLSPSQWTVQIPTPQAIPGGNSPSSGNPPFLGSVRSTPGNSAGNPSTPGFSNPRPLAQTPPAPAGVSLLESVQVTRDGFFLRTTGGRPQLIRTDRSRDRATMTFDLQGLAFSPNLTEPDVAVNRYGVSRVQFSVLETSPPTVRVTLNLNRNNPDWQATVSNYGGVVLLPVGTSASRLENTTTVVTPPSQNNPSVNDGSLATIQSVELGGTGNLLFVRSNGARPLQASGRSEGGFYRITINNAQLATNPRGPQLQANSLIRQVRLLQQDAQTVVIVLQPAPGVQIGELNPMTNQLLVVQLRGGQARNPIPGGTVNVPPPANNPTPTPSRPRNGRVLVMIDPGHGGKDPGAIGHRGIREVDVIMPVAQQVTALLEQQGVQVQMTRTADYFVDLQPRVTMAQRAGADLFVSIHANAIANRPDVQGLETYYFGNSSLARAIHNSVLQSVSVRDRGVRQARFYVLRRNSMPAALVELGFVTSPDESLRLASPEYQSQMANAIARGILQYIQQMR